ncbi:MAG: ATP-binding protein, partial [Leifsonia sp.]
MTDSPLFHMDGATEGTTQWRAESFQMVNWGGFHGHHAVAIAPSATLISGASGTGKSSLMDAYLALLMPSDTPFNGASNDAGSGRARSNDQRNLMTYLKGKTDSTRQAQTGEMHDTVLRGADSATWGGVAMTFVDDNQRRLTVLRTYFVPRGASRFGDISMKMATRDGTLDLRELADVVESRFEKRALKNRFAELEVFDTYAAFAQTLYSRLGIGANGEGGKALRLLARIQAGQQVKTVDGLYKSMVLEEPTTFAAADKAVAHFEDLERSYGAMLTEAQKAAVLERLPELYSSWEASTAQASMIDTVGVQRSGDTPFVLWSLKTEQLLLEQAEDSNRTGRRANQTALSAARDTENDLKSRVAAVQRQQRENGGDVLAGLASDVDQLAAHRDGVQAERIRFTKRIDVLDAAAESLDDFSAARVDAEGFLAGFAAADSELESSRTALHKESYPLEEQIRTLKQEKTFLTGRESLVPQHLHAARILIAEAAGLSIEELPFVAELIDMAPGADAWRRAAEVTLASVARVMLVDETRLGALSAAIEPLHIPVRIQFEGVALAPHQDAAGDPRYVSGKLVFKPSPFSNWVQDRVQASYLDALCVSGPAELAGDGPRVTQSGQTRNGRRGAHGFNSDQKPIIGFSSVARREEINAELGALAEQATAIAGRAAAVGVRLAELRAQKEAHQFVLDTVWQTIDVDAAEARVTEKKAELERVLANSDILRGLKDEEERLVAELEDAQKLKHLTELEAATLAAAQASIVDRQDAVSDVLERIESEQVVTLADEHAEHLDAQFAAVGDQTDLEAFAGGLRRLRERLTEQSQHDRRNAELAHDTLVGIFVTFQNRWPD